MSNTNPNVTDTKLAKLPIYHPMADWVTFTIVGTADAYNVLPGGILKPDNLDDSMLLVGKIVKRGPESKVPDKATHIICRRGDLKNLLMICGADGFWAASGNAIVCWERKGELVLL